MSMDDTQAQGQVADPVQDTQPTDQTSTTDQLATNDTPEATQGQTVDQESTTPETNATDTVQEKLYAGKYKSAEDMEKAYKELESKFGQTTNEKAELTRILNEAFAPTAQPTVSEPVDTVDAYGEEPTINNQTDDPTKRDLAVLKFTISHPDADGAAMQSVLASDPFISQINGYEAKLEYAYAKAQAQNAGKSVAQATKQAQAATQAKIVEKQSAQVETAQKATDVDKAELLNQATTAGPKEREAARLALIRKHLTKI